MGKFLNKYTYETAKKFVEENNCQLVTDNYLGMSEKHLFKCACGEIFETTFAKFQNRNKRQCNKCGRTNNIENQKHNLDYVRDYIYKFDCKLLSNEYKNNNSLLDIECKCGNCFQQSFTNFKNGKHQCQRCSQNDSNIFKCKYTYEYIYELLKKNNCILLTSKESKYILSKTPLNIKCKCDNTFETTIEMINTYNKFQCNDCGYTNSTNSKGELKIKEFLNLNNIQFKEQYSIEDCKNKYILRFDFAIFNNNNLLFLIEFDGIQHFKPFEYYGGEKTYSLILKRDKIKNEYCINNNLPLLRISYSEYSNIEKIITNYFNNMIISCQA